MLLASTTKRGRERDMEREQERDREGKRARERQNHLHGLKKKYIKAQALLAWLFEGYLLKPKQITTYSLIQILKPMLLEPTYQLRVDKRTNIVKAYAAVY